MSNQTEVRPEPGAYPRMQSRATGLDVTAFIAAFFPILGAILGPVAIREAHKAGRKASGLAIAGTIMSYVFLVILVIAVIAVSHGSATSPGGNYSEYVNCINGVMNGTVSSTANCSQYLPTGG